MYIKKRLAKCSKDHLANGACARWTPCQETGKSGELYSFWVSKWRTGESGGYLAGGGPEYADIIDRWWEGEMVGR